METINDIKQEKEEYKNYTFKDLIQGRILDSKVLKNNRLYFFVLVFLAIIYIDNHFKVESLLKEHLTLSREIKDLKYEAITTSSELMKKSRQSEVVRKVQENNLGLEVLTTPPKALTVKK